MRWLSQAAMLGGCLLVLAFSTARGSSGAPAAGQTVNVVFGTHVHDSGASLSALGEVEGPGSGLGGGPLQGVPDPFIHGSLPKVTYTQHHLGGDETFRLGVTSGRLLQSSRTKVLTLSVQMTKSSDPDCPGPGGSKPAARGRLVIVENEGGAGPRFKVTLDLPCGINEEWEGDAESSAMHVAVKQEQPATTTTKAAATAGTFVLAPGLTEVKNPNGPELTINPTGGTADWNHTGKFGGAGNGGDWQVKFSFKVPGTLVAGKTASLTIGLQVVSGNPAQPTTFQMTALAPDFAQAVAVKYPTQSSVSKDFTLPLSAGYGDPGFKEITITIGVVSAAVVYHYKRAG